MKKRIFNWMGIWMVMLTIAGCGLLKKGCNCPKAKTSSLFYPNINKSNDHLYCA